MSSQDLTPDVTKKVYPIVIEFKNKQVRNLMEDSLPYMLGSLFSPENIKRLIKTSKGILGDGDFDFQVRVPDIMDGYEVHGTPIEEARRN